MKLEELLFAEFAQIVSVYKMKKFLKNHWAGIVFSVLIIVLSVKLHPFVYPQNAILIISLGIILFAFTMPYALSLVPKTDQIHFMRSVLSHVLRGDHTIMAKPLPTMFAQPDRETAYRQLRAFNDEMIVRWP